MDSSSPLFAFSEHLAKHRERLVTLGRLEERRASQQRDWMWTMADEEVTSLLRHGQVVKAMRAQVEADVAAGRISAVEGTEKVLAAFASDPELARWRERG